MDERSAAITGTRSVQRRKVNTKKYCGSILGDQSSLSSDETTLGELKVSET